MTEVRVQDLSKHYGPVGAVDRLTFTAPAGAVTAFLGPNGAGKTTTMRMLLGLVEPTGGSATVGGLRYRDLPEPRRAVGAVLESSCAHPGLRGRTHLRLLARAAGLPARRVEEVLDTVQLGAAADRRVGGYSLGMRQRLALAGALLGDPQVLVLDEPTNGLDPEGVRWLRELLRGLARQGRTVLVSSHLLAEVDRSADRVVIVSGGRLRFEGSHDALTAGGATLEEAFLALVGDDRTEQQAVTR